MIRIGEKRLKFEDFHKIIFKGEKIEIDEKALQKVNESFLFLKDFSKDKIIYGINTGFGPMAQYRISDEDGLRKWRFIT